MNIKNKNTFYILHDIEKMKIEKNWVLENINQFCLKELNILKENALMYIIRNNIKFGFTKNDILGLLEKFDLSQQSILKYNVLMYIGLYGTAKNNLDFTSKEILGILNKFNLKQTDVDGQNFLHLIMANKLLNEKFNKEEILEIFQKFDLAQRNKKRWSFYDFAKESIAHVSYCFSNDDLEVIISKLHINMTNKFNKNILIKELEDGMNIKNEELVQKILNTKNEE